MIDHPNWEQVVDYVEGRLDDASATSLSTHLAGCPLCRADTEWLQHTLPQMRHERFPAPPDHARATVLAAFIGERDRAERSRFTSRRERWYSKAPLIWGIVAAAAVLIIALFLRRGEPVVYVAAVQEYSGRVLVGPAGVPLQPV
ncbi:MAG: anti-sigma factor family protein, partial [Ardenticatenaceae bacterium]